jgi:hypothetical protein
VIDLLLCFVVMESLCFRVDFSNCCPSWIGTTEISQKWDFTLLFVCRKYRIYLYCPKDSIKLIWTQYPNGAYIMCMHLNSSKRQLIVGNTEHEYWKSQYIRHVMSCMRHGYSYKTWILGDINFFMCMVHSNVWRLDTFWIAEHR